MKNQLGGQFIDFQNAHTRPGATGILANQLKRKVLPFQECVQVPWCSNGYTVVERPIFTLDPLFHAGCYYVMEPSSMFLMHLLKSLKLPGRPLRALDLCAAPGGKSMVLLSFLNHDDLLVSNEVIQSRKSILDYNVVKSGALNCFVSNHDPADFSRLDGYFDIVLVDAPCSGEGLFRKDQDAMQHWTPDHVRHCALRQSRILDQAAHLLTENGYLIYATCTYNFQENIDQIIRVQEKYDLIQSRISVPKQWDIEIIEKLNAIGYQFYPHRVPGEGLFMSILQASGKSKRPGDSHRNQSPNRVRKLRKKLGINKKDLAPLKPFVKSDGALYRSGPSGERVFFRPFAEAAEVIQLALPRTRTGIEIGTLKNGIFRPAHALALSHHLSPEVERIEVSRELAISYLRKEKLPEIQTENGWKIITFEDTALGWAKQTSAGLKNYYPTQQRIRMSS